MLIEEGNRAPVTTATPSASASQTREASRGAHPRYPSFHDNGLRRQRHPRARQRVEMDA